MTLSQLNVRIGQEEHDHLEALAFQTEGILTKAGVVRLLIRHAMEVGWDPLDRVRKLPAYRVGAGNQVGHPQPQVEPPNAADAQEASAACQVLGSSEESFPSLPVTEGDGVGKESEETPRKWEGKPRFVFSVPADLDWCKADLLEFWREYKSGRKSRAAADLLIKGIREIDAKYGQKVVMAQLELAKANCWESITLSNYERFGLPRSQGNSYVPPEPPKHPASRLFMNGRWVDEEPPVTNPLLADAF
jgi:hypothetical protein